MIFDRRRFQHEKSVNVGQQIIGRSVGYVTTPDSVTPLSQTRLTDDESTSFNRAVPHANDAPVETTKYS